MRAERAIAPRTRTVRTLILALAATLAVIVAPVCAPLCAAQACVPGNAAGGCHGMAGMNADANTSVSAVHKTCRRGELPAILTRVATSGLTLLETSGHTLAFCPEGGCAPQGLRQNGQGGGLQPWSLFERGDVAALVSVLRI